MGVISLRINVRLFCRLLLHLVCLLIVISGESISFAQGPTSADQNVSIGIARISELAISGDPQPFILVDSVRTTGSVILDRTTSYRLTTNVESAVLRAEIDAPMPPGTRLTLAAETSNGVGLGEQDITEASRSVDLVVSIGPGLENGRILSYSVHIDSSLTKLDTQERTVTVILCDLDGDGCSRSSQSIVFGIEPTE